MSHQSAPAGGRQSPSAGSPMNTTPRRRARLRPRESLSNVPVKATAADVSLTHKDIHEARLSARPRPSSTIGQPCLDRPPDSQRASPVRCFGGRSVLVFRAAVAGRPLRVLAMVGRNSFFQISSYDELLVFSRTTRVAVFTLDAALNENPPKTRIASI